MESEKILTMLLTKDQDFSGAAVKALDIVQTMINQQIPLRFIASWRLRCNAFKIKKAATRTVATFKPH